MRSRNFFDLSDFQTEFICQSAGLAPIIRKDDLLANHCAGDGAESTVQPPIWDISTLGRERVFSERISE